MEDFNCIHSIPSQGLSWDGPPIGLAAPPLQRSGERVLGREGRRGGVIGDEKRFFKLSRALNEVAKNGEESTMSKEG